MLVILVDSEIKTKGKEKEIACTYAAASAGLRLVWSVKGWFMPGCFCCQCSSEVSQGRPVETSVVEIR